MRNRVVPIASIVLFFCAVTAHPRAMSDWWGPAPVDIAVQVISAVTGEAIQDAVVSVASLDEPFPRRYTQLSPSEAITDEEGFAMVRAEFDGSGSTREQGGWYLQGNVVVERQGYQTFSASIAA